MKITKRLALLGLMALSITIGAVFLLLVSSAWFYWALLPQSDLSLAAALDNTQPHADIFQKTLAVSQALPLLPVKIAGLPKMAFAQKKDSTYIVIRAPFGQVGRIKSIFLANGWTVENWGNVIRASRQPSNFSQITLPTPTQAVWVALGHLLRHPTSFLPVFLASLADESGNQPYQAIVFARNTALEGSVSISGNSPSQLTQSLGKVNEIKNNVSLVINIPSQLLRIIPEQYQAAWQEKAWKELGFLKTRPPFLRELGQHQIAIISANEGKITLGVMGDAETFTAKAASWMQEEDAFNRSRKKAFQLPDKTLGYELLPGLKRDVLGPLDAKGCAPSSSEYLKLWLCRQGTVVLLSSNEDMALKVATTANMGQSIIRKPIADMIGIPLLQSVQVQAVPKGLNFRLDFSKN